MNCFVTNLIVFLTSVFKIFGICFQSCYEMPNGFVLLRTHRHEVLSCFGYILLFFKIILQALYVCVVLIFFAPCSLWLRTEDLLDATSTNV